jgi:hypothetical protein
VEDLLARLTDAGAEAAAASGGAGAALPLGGLAAGLNGGEAREPGAALWDSGRSQPLEGLDLMVRALKMYCLRA